MKLRRLGRVFSSEMGPDWMVSHAAYPTPVLMPDGRIRVLFNARDSLNRGQGAWIDLDPANPLCVVGMCRRPSLAPGETGAFDDRGVSNGSVLATADGLRLYYMGWNKSADAPFRNAIGAALSQDCGETFERLFQGPLVDRSRFDPFTISYPFVEAGPRGAPLRMFYGTSRAGGAREDEMLHALTEAVSQDGIDWRPTGRDVIPLEAGEYGLSRPWIIGETMLFSIRRAQYTIGAARRGQDGAWTRISADVLGPGEGWDGAATCYPAAITAQGRSYMFYCGDGYGKTGFGVALIEDLE